MKSAFAQWNRASLQNKNIESFRFNICNHWHLIVDWYHSCNGNRLWYPFRLLKEVSVKNSFADPALQATLSCIHPLSAHPLHSLVEQYGLVATRSVKSYISRVTRVGCWCSMLVYMARSPVWGSMARCAPARNAD